MASLTVTPASHAAPRPAAPSRVSTSSSDASNADAADKKRRKPDRRDSAAINGEAATAGADTQNLASAQRTHRAAVTAVRTLETPKPVLVDTTPTETA